MKASGARLAVLSDLHANLSAFMAVEEDLRRRGVQAVVVLGDLVGYLARPNRVVSLVAQRVGRGRRQPSASEGDGPPAWLAISGNYDLAVLCGGTEGADGFLKPGIGPEPLAVYEWTCRRVDAASRAFLSSLPRSLTIDIGGAKALAVHGSPEGVRDYVYPDRDPDQLAQWIGAAGVGALLMGHTHRPFVRQVRGGLAINPGSVGKSKDGDPRASYAIISVGPELGAEIVRVDYDLEAEAGLLVQAGLPGAGAERLRQGI